MGCFSLLLVRYRYIFKCLHLNRVRIFDQDRCRLASVRSGENSSFGEPSRLLLPCKVRSLYLFHTLLYYNQKAKLSKAEFQPCFLISYETEPLVYIQAHASVSFHRKCIFLLIKFWVCAIIILRTIMQLRSNERL